MESNTALNDLLASYVKLAAQEEELKKQKDLLKSQITVLMGDESKYEDSGYSCALVESTTYKYPDEISAIKTLETLGASRFVVSTIDTKALNDYLKKNSTSEIASTLLKENLVQPTKTTRLIVKEV